ncbi:GNAT family N-acetyltransferase [Flammeovirga aprica]|uniref:GNAT family N-acetyltransferase n=1 Tax=Flammeovirga aprica JL-4 TaxID=694437 RepID=A0A7X9S1D8_9BACT|nr:GNAT family protein [Flammeovirga aprica]NME72632.1 GNAT family N-acetyltransferase [Flammeovirga aprica JL-4]
MNITIREIQLKDIPHLVDYWTKSDKEHLINMGVDLSKLPKEEEFKGMLESQISQPYTQKQNYALIVLADNSPIGHVNINEIDFGNSAKMHLHLWDKSNRKSGIGTQMIQLALPLFFENFQLKQLICEPYAKNDAPNKTLEKVGFQFVKKYTSVPGSINFEQEVNQWQLIKNN